MTAGQATCVQSANMGQREQHSLESLCVPLPVVPVVSHQGQSELWLLRRGQSQGNPRSVSTWAGLVGSGRPFLAAVLLQGSLSPASSPSLSHCPFLSVSSTADSPDPQSTAEFSRVSSSSTPTLTPSSLLSSLGQEPSVIQGLSWLLGPCPSPLPFHLLHAPHSPTFCRSSLLGFLLPFVLYLPYTLSHLLIPFLPALFSPPPHLQGVKDHSLKGIASTSNCRIQMQKRLR